MSNSAAPKLKNTDGGSVSVTESISFSKPQQRLFTPPHHQVFNSAPSKLNFNAGGSGTVTESIGSNPQISAEPVPSQELPSVFESPQKPFSGLSSLRGKNLILLPKILCSFQFRLGLFFLTKENVAEADGNFFSIATVDSSSSFLTFEPRSYVVERLE